MFISLLINDLAQVFLNESEVNYQMGKHFYNLRLEKESVGYLWAVLTNCKTFEEKKSYISI